MDYASIRFFIMGELKYFQGKKVEVETDKLVNYRTVTSVRGD